MNDVPHNVRPSASTTKERMDAFMSLVQPESAAELLTRIRRKTDPPGPTFISDLDDHISAAIPGLFSGDSTLNRGDIIEIQGPASSGKTQLLQFFAMTCILPQDVQASCAITIEDARTETPVRTVLLGGREKAVAIFDCDGRWQMRRLHEILHSYISSKFAQEFENVRNYAEPLTGATLEFKPGVDDVIRVCLQRVHIFRPTSSMSLATTLRSLPNYLQRGDAANQELLMLFIDSISAFHHADKWRAEEAAILAGSTPLQNRGAEVQRADLKPMTHILSALQSLQKTLGIVTFITNWALVTSEGKSVNNQKYENSKPFYGQHLLPPYPAIPNHPNQPAYSFAITHHITLPGTEFAILPYPPGTSLADALQDEERRAVVEDSRVTAIIRTPLPDPGDQTKSIATGSFEFAIRDYSIAID